MKITSTRLPEVLLIEPKVFTDERGHFFESFNQRIFEEAVGRAVTFVQDNQSLSKKGVLRGLHYQLPPYEQGKLVRVVEGEVFDVAVDIRRDSPNFGQWVGVHLSSTNKHQLWIPEGFAHGFLAISDSVQVLYKATSHYHTPAEKCLLWNDPSIGIEWPKSDMITLSFKDKSGELLKFINT
jgi:dTDP-4-dehydrorhamnose 3,5-epimerase